MLGQFRPGYDRVVQVRPGEFRLGQIIPGYAG
jgi:hypothetical protein